MLIKFISILLVLVSVVQANSLSGRIINGQDANEILPYHAQLGIRRGDEPERAGSGVIITIRLVLTAATNIYGFDTFRAGFGSKSRGNLIWANGTEASYLPSYNPLTYENNVGFIIFKVGAFLNDYVVPIAIPPLTVQQTLPLENEQGRIAGFGWTQNGVDSLSDILQITFNRVVSWEECDHLYDGDQASNFCAVDSLGRSKICAGDQGTAFVTNAYGKEYLTGIASYIVNYNCVPDVPALFVRLLAYRKYIDVMTLLWQ